MAVYIGVMDIYLTRPDLLVVHTDGPIVLMICSGDLCQNMLVQNHFMLETLEVNIL